MDYECIGICTPDPQSGLCQGCGRPLQEPLQPVPAAPATEAAKPAATTADTSVPATDSPCS